MSALTSIGNTEQGPSPSYISSHPVVQEECGSAAVSSMKGVKPGRPHWINQDNFFLLHTTVGDLYCVLDGHGEHGHYVSRRCRNLLPQFVQSTLDLSKAFAQMQEDLLDATEVRNIFIHTYICLHVVYLTRKYYLIIMDIFITV
jgi:hypothetical protein